MLALTTVVEAFVGLVLVWAGALKLAQPAQLLLTLQHLQVPRPMAVVPLLAGTEIGIGAILLVGAPQPAGSVAAMLLLTGFLVVKLRLQRLQFDSDCGCFGSFGARVLGRAYLNPFLNAILTLALGVSIASRRGFESDPEETRMILGAVTATLSLGLVATVAWLDRRTLSRSWSDDDVN